MDPLAPTDDHEIQRRALERMKELDHAHRTRFRSAARLTLSLRFLKRAFEGLRGTTAPGLMIPVPHPAAGGMAVTFVGHATAMLTTPRTRVLTDPLLGNFLLGLRRARGAGIAVDDLEDVGMIVVSHAHHDHLRRQSLRILPKGATCIVPPRCADLLSDLGFSRVIELGVGSNYTLHDVEVIAVPVRHDGARGGLDFTRRGAVGYVIRTNEVSAYFAGDTAYFSGFAEIGRHYHPDVALLPIAGYEPASFRTTHMSPLDAVYAFEDLGARLLVPIAHGSFPLGYEPLDAPLEWLRDICAERGLQDKLCALDHGETFLVRRAVQAPEDDDVPVDLT